MQNQLRSSPIVDNLSTKTCASCNETKPLKEFKRRLSLAQTRAFLRQPNATTRYITDSKNCSSCRQQRKRYKPLTQKQIRSKITTGDMHHVIGEAKLQKIRQAIPKRRAKVMKEYWEKKRLGWQDELKTNLQKQVTAYANRYYSYQNQMPEQPTPNQNALLLQHSYNYKEAQRVRKDLMERARGGEVIDPATKIETQIKRRKVGDV